MEEKRKKLSEKEKEKFKIVKEEAIKDCVEQMKDYARYLKKPVRRVIDGKIIVVHPDGKICKDITLDNFFENES